MRLPSHLRVKDVHTIQVVHVILTYRKLSKLLDTLDSSLEAALLRAERVDGGGGAAGSGRGSGASTNLLRVRGVYNQVWTCV